MITIERSCIIKRIVFINGSVSFIRDIENVHYTLNGIEINRAESKKSLFIPYQSIKYIENFYATKDDQFDDIYFI